jgi:hypothetical protein
MIGLMLCIGFCVAGRLIYRASIWPNHYIITYEPIFSHALSDQIERFMPTLWEHYRSNPSYMLEKLITEFPIIAQGTLAYTPHRAASIKINAHKPLALINQNAVVTHTGLIFDKSVFYEPYLDTLPKLEVRSSDMHNELKAPYFLSFVQSILPALYDVYTIVWHNKTEIELIDKERASFSILCHAEQNITETLLQACRDLQSASGRSKNVCADIRFNQSIIIGERG